MKKLKFQKKFHDLRSETAQVNRVWSVDYMTSSDFRLQKSESIEDCQIAIYGTLKKKRKCLHRVSLICTSKVLQS